MLKNPGSFGLLSKTSLRFSRSSPIRFLTVLAALIFVAELTTMALLYFLDLPNYSATSILDGILMLILIMPGLYYLQLKPLLEEMQERNRAANELRTSEELLRNVLENLPVGVMIIDQNGTIIQGNPASKQIWSDLHFVGMSEYGEYKAWWPETGELIKSGEWAGARAITRGETSINEEIEIESFDGAHKFILNSAVPILGEKSVQGAIVVNQDITHRKLAAEELIKKNELLERLFASIDILIAYLDRNFNFIRVNEAYAKSGGYAPEYFIGKNHFDLYPNEENESIFRQVLESGQPYIVLEKPFEYQEFPERGVTYWDWSLQPVMGAREAEGLVLSLVDVTERKHAEMELERRNKELRELYEAESTARRVSEALSAASRTLSQSLDLHQVIQALLDNLGIILDFDAAGITILENQSHPAIRFSRGSKDRQISDSLPFIDVDEITDSLINRMHREKKSLVLPNSVHRTAASAGQTDETIHTWLVAPIDASDHIIGLVELGTSNEGNFSPERIRWAEALVSQASVAIQNALLFEEVRSSRERLQSLTRKLVQVQETERYHIARELHDEAGQALSSLKLSLGRLQQDPDCPGQIRDQLDDLKDLADGVLEELHRMAINLRPVVLDRLGIVAALEQYAHHLSVERLSIQFKSIGFEDERLPQDVETAIYRIVQEALTNVVRHSGARSVGVLMEWDEDTVKVFVEDDGIGISPDSIESKERLGLVGMRERAEMFGGNLTVESSSNEGTSIIVEVPVAHTNSNRR